MVDTTTTTDPTTTGTSIQDYMSQQVQNPTMPDAAIDKPVDQTVSNGELMDNSNGQYNIPATPAPASTSVDAQKVDPNTVTNNFNTAVGQYSASTGNNVAQGTAVQGTVNAATDTVQGQLKSLYADTANGQTPEWAQGAVATAENALAARGLGASSIGASAITAAVQSSALNIATSDAATYFQMNMANLSNAQQTNLVNIQNRQQGLLSDQAATNASLQFNASSAAQTQQFIASLVSSIQTQNADRAQAAGEFNTSEEDKTNQFNSTLEYNRDQFNSQMQYAIDQSNVQWRRTVNTQNTATQNAANQVNAQNAFNLSATSLNNLWQEFRDQANYAFTAGQNQDNRDTNMAIAANNQNFALNLNNQQTASQQVQQMYSAIGGFATSLFS